jgi:hypothetical protein
MTFINGLSLGVKVDKSRATKVHETATLPYSHGSRLNPSVQIKTGERSLVSNIKKTKNK